MRNTIKLYWSTQADARTAGAYYTVGADAETGSVDIGPIQPGHRHLDFWIARHRHHCRPYGRAPSSFYSDTVFAGLFLGAPAGIFSRADAAHALARMRSPSLDFFNRLAYPDRLIRQLIKNRSPRISVHDVSELDADPGFAGKMVYTFTPPAS